MGLNSEDPIQFIKHLLESKSSAKQTAYKHICDAFSTLMREAKCIVDELKRRAKPSDKDVTVEFNIVSEQEFDVKLAGDMLIFVMSNNVVTLEDSHAIMKEDYIRENEVNRYFGQIMVYNFMAESLKHHRNNDPGYLLARLMVNHERRFFIDGERELERYNTMSEHPISEEDLKQVVKIVLKMAIENDLVAPAFTEVKSITLSQKRDHTLELGGAQKIGFRMSYEQKTEG
ncbi:MAG TPA: hypothetical protein VFO54_02820 [Chryseosolibacter sp.]|nr:hypothetical protein [Chryseosolibacter sp.]